MKLIEKLTKKIRNPLGEFKEESEVKLILRKRLTKKEYKILFFDIDTNLSKQELMEKLSIDETRFKELKESISKKLNRDSIKRDLYKL